MTWQPDLAFFPFSYNGKELLTNQLSEIFGEVKIIMTQIRDSILFSGSTLINDPKKSTRPFSNFIPDSEINLNNRKEEREAWAAKWLKELNQNWELQKADYYIFYNTEKPVVALVFPNEKKPFVITEYSFGFTNLEKVLSLLTPLFSQADDELTLYTDF